MCAECARSLIMTCRKYLFASGRKITLQHQHLAPMAHSAILGLLLQMLANRKETGVKLRNGGDGCQQGHSPRPCDSANSFQKIAHPSAEHVSKHFAFFRGSGLHADKHSVKNGRQLQRNNCSVDLRAQARAEAGNPLRAHISSNRDRRMKRMNVRPPSVNALGRSNYSIVRGCWLAAA